MKMKPWLLFTLITTLSWGVWGAFMEFPEKFGFPATLGYTTWAIMMIPCALIVLGIGKWKLDYDFKSVLYGSVVGLLGAGGQLILFNALKEGPAYIIFPIISLYPVITVLLSTTILKEKGNIKSWIGVAIALIAILLLSYQKPGDSTTKGYLWLLLAVLIFIMWGLQAFVMKLSNEKMKAESIFFYMMLTAVMLIPVALLMTDFSVEINWGFKGPILSAMIQILNAVGALCLVYALRYGKAIVVTPLTALAPVITIILSLIIYSVIPHWIVIVGMVSAVVAIFMLADEG